ncbi:DNA-directed RNA polymerase III subunit RPC10 [Teratosphaeria destructans]|uniref:DNA-directed RNA polymerase III subunit RPC10 n=1 Tax=Teratosphaeria destructans TaxID=418781 RepID=A0A9W7SZ22_9PEZI|nr:DNA-directed RNA polymerase III subunit RPC10 [Teratosphaeria destructans]
MDQATPSDPNIGKNRFECRTCPYQMVLDKKYYERKNFELKGAEDVLGGADSWKVNHPKMLLLIYFISLS